MDEKPRRRWSRFSLRTLFVVVTVVAVPLGWVGYQLNWIRQRRELFRTVLITEAPFIADYHSRPDAPVGLQMFGERGYHGLWIRSEDPDLLRRVQDAFPEADIEPRH